MENELNIIHAHELLDFINTNPQFLSMEEIKQNFTKQFGEVSFTNCTSQIYNFDEIIEFLKARNKITVGRSIVTVKTENRCK